MSVVTLADAPTAILDNPVYVTLNLCRTLAYLDDGIVRSKAQGGEWACAHLPDCAIVRAALQAYRDGVAFPRFSPFDLSDFAQMMLRRIQIQR